MSWPPCTPSRVGTSTDCGHLAGHRHHLDLARVGPAEQVHVLLRVSQGALLLSPAHPPSRRAYTRDSDACPHPFRHPPVRLSRKARRKSARPRRPWLVCSRRSARSSSRSSAVHWTKWMKTRVPCACSAICSVANRLQTYVSAMRHGTRPMQRGPGPAPPVPAFFGDPGPRFAGMSQSDGLCCLRDAPGRTACVDRQRAGVAADSVHRLWIACNATTGVHTTR